MLLVVKRSGNVEQFDRNKVISGVRKACQGRPINEDDLKMLGQKVEEDLRSRGLAQVKFRESGGLPKGHRRAEGRKFRMMA